MIEFKGRQGGSLKCIVPSDMSERQVIEGFSRLVAGGSKMLRGSEVEVDLQDRHFTPALLSKIWKNFIEPCECRVINWVVADGETREILGRMGFRVTDTPLSDMPRKEAAAFLAPAAEARKKGLFSPAFVYSGTLRGGQNISHAGDVIVTGNVNQGAEIRAKGNVTITGRLNGLVHAGCEGDDEMAVIVRSLETGQIRIGSKVGIIDRESVFWGTSVSVTINNGEVLVVPWPAL